MNTIVVNENDIPDKVILPHKLLSEFIFNHFELIIHAREAGAMVKLEIEIDGPEDVIWVQSLSPKVNTAWEFHLEEVDKDDDYCDFYNDLNQRIVLCQRLTEEYLESILMEGNDDPWFVTYSVVKLMAYIMAYPRKQKEVKPLHKYSREYRLSTKQNKIYLFSDILKYVSDTYVPEGRHHEMQCPCWEVRGHYRHYKSGKVVFIPAFKKGKQRNKVEPQSKEYIV